MRKNIFALLVVLFLGTANGYSQGDEAEQLLLDVEKLAQLKNILSDLKKGYETLYKGYTTIKNISQGNFHLHDAFLDALLQVSPAVKNYRRVEDIVSAQVKIVHQYKKAFRDFTTSGQFTPEEITYLGKVYAGLFDQSVKNLETLTTVLTSGKLRMSDDERLKEIDTVWNDMEEELTFLTRFNCETKVLALQRAKESADVTSQKHLYSIH